MILTQKTRLLFVKVAVRAGMILSNYPIGQMQAASATEIIMLCVQVVDRYLNPECTRDTVGKRDHEAAV